MRFRVAALSVCAVGAAAVAATADAGAAVRGRALVLLDRQAPSASASSIAAVHTSATAVLARHSLHRARPDVPEVGLVTVRVPRGTSFRDLAGALRRDRRVRRVEPEARHQQRLLPADPALTQPDPTATSGIPYQWYLLREGFPSAWDLSRGAGVRIGVIDSGIDLSHPELAGKVAIARDQDAGPGGTADQVGHGSHVGGIACGATNNAAGIAGAGFDCQLVVEKSDLTSSSVVASLVDATNKGAKVINMSFGGGRLTSAELRALRYAFKHDVVLIAAAADSPSVEQGHPAKDLQPTGTGSHLDEGEGLVVTAADSTGTRASFAGHGSQISLAAFGDTGPGGAPGIFSAFPSNTTTIETGATNPPSPPCPSCRTTFNGDPRYGYLAGTSMASPQVAGAVALVRAADPKLSNLSVIRLMKATAQRSAGWSSELGWGIVDAGAAVRGALALARDTIAPKTTPRGGRSRRSGRHFTLRWRGRDRAGPGIKSAGVEAYRIYARRGKRRYRLVVTTRFSSAGFTGTRGSRYSFYVQARDRAGNLEPAPRNADFVVRVSR
jgi:subtilisin family serine protease